MVENLRAYLDVQDQPSPQAYVGYLKQLVHRRLRRLDLELPGAGLGRDRPDAAVLDLPRRRPRSLLAFLLGTAIGMIAAWRRGGIVDNVLTPSFMALGAFPAFFTSLLAVYFLGLKLGWFPIQHAYDLGARAGLQLGRSSRARSGTRSCRS